MQAKSLRCLRHDRFADGGLDDSLRPRQVKQLNRALPVGLQNAAQSFQLALLLAVGDQIFGKIDDAVKFIGGDQLAELLLFAQRDGFDV